MKTEVVIASASVVIAICALFLSLWQARQTVRHNKLSVLPKLNGHTSQLSDVGIVGFSLKNLGLGPAHVVESRAFKDGKEIEYRTSSELSNELISTLRKEGIYDLVENVSTGRIGNDTFLASGNSIDIALVRLSKLPATDDDLLKVREALNRFDLFVKYQSVYGEEFTYDSTDGTQKESPA